MPEPSLLVTKFTIPPVRATLLPREPLIKILNQSCSSPLILLSASAGFGKTTLLSTWASQSSNHQVAWLSLDEQDNDPARFWAYVIAALRKAGIPLGEATLAMLQSSQSLLLTSFLTSLINEIAAQAQDTALILDDYHLISEQAIHESLQFLLDHLPPCLHLLLASRVDPPLALSRLRARGQMVEISDTDLRLSNGETASFLTQVMELALSEEDIHLLETRTEGWIAGLQLAALSLRKHTDRSAFIKAFSGSQRFILDYMQEEILERLPELHQRFLLQTSVLERLNADICQALTGEQASQQILESLERSNLFLIPLDEERHWYRFHVLFREVLLVRLQATWPEQFARLHREAALWYQQQGWWNEAIPHGLATLDFLFVAELLEGCVEHLFLQGELKTLLTWIKRLPAEVLYAHPRLSTSYLLAFHLLFPFPQQEQEERAYLQQLQEGVESLLQSKDQAVFSRQELDRLHHRMTILKAWDLAKMALSEGNVEQLSKIVEQTRHLPLDDDAAWQQHSWGSLAMVFRLAGNFPPMVAILQESRKRTQVTQNSYQEVQILWGLIIALIALGQISQAHDRCLELQQLVDRLGSPIPVAVYPHVFQAQFAYERNHLEMAKSEALIAIEKMAPLQYLDILMMAYEVTARCDIARGDQASAEQAIREMEQMNKNISIPLFRPRIESLRVQLWLAQGDLAQAVDWAEHTSYQKLALLYNSESASLALVRIYLAQHQYPLALQWLTALLSSAEQVSRVGSMIPILALQVAALQESGATQEALHVLPRLLTLAKPEGYLRVFPDAGEPMYQALQGLLATEQEAISPVVADYARRALDAFLCPPRQALLKQSTSPFSPSLPPALSQAATPLLDPLTPREMEVLHLLAEGTSNQEIARQLVISPTTAKKHVANILSKLGAENRTQAIAHARSHSLL